MFVNLLHTKPTNTERVWGLLDQNEFVTATLSPVTRVYMREVFRKPVGKQQ